MKSKLIIIMAIAALAFMVVPASAGLYHFEVTGTSVAGSDIAAEANVTTGAGTVLVELWNTQVPMQNISQVLSDFSFALSDTPTGAASLAAPTVGTERAFNFNGLGAGVFQDTADQPFTWGLTTVGNTVKLDDLSGGDSPIHTIIGPPDVGGTYSSGNAGLIGNAASSVPEHSPYLFGTESDPVAFLLDVPGITADTIVPLVTFSFGTTPGDNHTVPLPPSALLMGSGLLGLGLAGWRWKSLLGK